jgi:single-strand DNA-binding protein
MKHNRITIVGNATRAASVQKPEGKTAYCDFTVAVNRNREEADFFPVRAFGKLTEVAARIEKGSLVLVSGRVEINRFAPKDGEPRTSVRLLADAVSVLQLPARSPAIVRVAEDEG